MAAAPATEIHFGGPDLPRGRLRDLLAERTAAVPPGGVIHWVAYYFRDRRLAAELLRARRRGVDVAVTVEGRPRSPHANDAVAAMLRGARGLGGGFRALTSAGVPTGPGRAWKPHSHQKLYYFSHPRPVAYIGSFNPSGDDPESDPAVIRAIGDQDRGHNALVGLRDPVLAGCLLAHARRLHGSRCAALHRFSAFNNRVWAGRDTEIHFWPRATPHPVVRFLAQTPPGAVVRVAASHLKDRFLAMTLAGLARRGATVEILAEATRRRVPDAVARRMARAGIPFRRVDRPEGVPMHNKFVLVEKGDRKATVFGSFNWTTRSRWLNFEIGAVSHCPEVYAAFDRRWKVLASCARRGGDGQPEP